MSHTPKSFPRLPDRRIATTPQPLDPADMGCSLGLEMSFGAELPPPLQVVPAPRTPPQARTHWWQRLHLSGPAHA